MEGISSSFYDSPGTGGSAGTSFAGVSVSMKEKKSSASYKGLRDEKVRIKVSFSAAGAMIKLARAQTKTQAASIERSLRAKLQEAKRFNSDAGTVRAIQKAVGKAGSKVKALGREERMEMQRKAARACENRRAEARIAAELSGKRRARKRREKNDITEAKVDDLRREEQQARQQAAELTAAYQDSFQDSSFDMICGGIELSAEPVVSDVSLDVLV